MNTIHLLTGSNIGNSVSHLKQARIQIENKIGNIVAASSLYQTEPWGNTNQQDFLNQVLQVETNLTAQQVLETILSIETQMGRNRLIKWEPRIIDIDLLFYSSTIIDTPELTVPHPLLHERKFTLLPLHEIAPDLIHPIFHKSIAELLLQCADTSEVNKIDNEMIW